MTETPTETRTVVTRIEDGRGNILSSESHQVPVIAPTENPVKVLEDAVAALDEHEITDPALQAIADAVKALAAASPGGRRPKPSRG